MCSTSSLLPTPAPDSASLRDRTRQLASGFTGGDASPAITETTHPCVEKLRASFETCIRDFLDCSVPEEEEVEQNAVLEKLQRYSRIKTELRHLSVARSTLAFHAIKDQVVRDSDGKLRSKDGVPLSLLIARLVCDHPELIRFAS